MLLNSKFYATPGCRKCTSLPVAETTILIDLGYFGLFSARATNLRIFAQLEQDQFPSWSVFHSAIRQIQTKTLKQVCEVLTIEWVDDGTIDPQVTSIDSTVVSSNIEQLSDSQLLDDGICVLNRLLSRSKVRLKYPIFLWSRNLGVEQV